MKRTQLYPLKFPLFYVAGRLDPCSARQQLILKALTASFYSNTTLSVQFFFLTGHSLNEIWINPKSVSSFLPCCNWIRLNQYYQEHIRYLLH